MTKYKHSDESIVLNICSLHCGFEVDLQTKMKTMGYLDSLTSVELLTRIAKAIKFPINWKANFAQLDTPQSFLDALSNKSDYWQIAFCNPWDE